MGEIHAVSMPGILLGKLDVCGAIMIALESISPTEAGDRLRSARGNADLAQQEAADEISIASTTLVAIEKECVVSGLTSYAGWQTIWGFSEIAPSPRSSAC